MLLRSLLMVIREDVIGGGKVLVEPCWLRFFIRAADASRCEVGQPRPSWSNFASLAAVSRHVAKKPRDASTVADRGRYYIYAANRGRLAGTTVGTSVSGIDVSLATLYI